jgi:tetratricopeptide (TPR) repeat protein
MNKIHILLPLACSIPVLLGQAVAVHAQEQTLRVEPVMSVRHSEAGIDVWYRLGRQHQENKRLDLAGNAYRHVLANDAAHIDARNALATVYSQQNRFDEAVAEFQTLLQANPKLAYLYNNLGYTYLLKADYLKAISAFGNAIVLEPGNFRAFGNLALAYERLGNGATATAAATPAPAPLGQAQPPKEPQQSAPAAALPTPDTVQTAHAAQTPDAVAATPAAQPAVVAQAAEAAAPADAQQPALNGIVIEISNGTRDAKLGEYLANALRQEGVTVTRVTAMKPYTQRRNVILYRDGFYKQALALSRSFSTPPALVNNTHGRAPSDKADVRLVLGKSALQSSQVASSGESGPAF